MKIRILMLILLGILASSMIGCGQDEKKTISDSEIIEEVVEEDIVEDEYTKTLQSIAVVDFEQLTKDIDINELQDFATEYAIQAIHGCPLSEAKVMDWGTVREGADILSIKPIGCVWQKWQDESNSFYHNQLTVLLAEEIYFGAVNDIGFWFYPVFAKDICLNDDGTYEINFEMNVEQSYNHGEQVIPSGSIGIDYKEDIDYRVMDILLEQCNGDKEKMAELLVTEWKSAIIDPVFSSDYQCSFLSNEATLNNLVKGRAINEYEIISDDYEELLEIGIQKFYADAMIEVNKATAIYAEESGKFPQ